MVPVVVAATLLILMVFWVRACVRDARRNRELELSADPWSGQPIQPRRAVKLARVQVKVDRS